MGFSTPVGHIWEQAGWCPPQPEQSVFTTGTWSGPRLRPGQIRQRLHFLQVSGSAWTRCRLGLLFFRQAPSRTTMVV
jgi:hypothetical protein